MVTSPNQKNLKNVSIQAAKTMMTSCSLPLGDHTALILRRISRMTGNRVSLSSGDLNAWTLAVPAWILAGRSQAICWCWSADKYILIVDGDTPWRSSWATYVNEYGWRIPYLWQNSLNLLVLLHMFCESTVLVLYQKKNWTHSSSSLMSNPLELTPTIPWSLLVWV